VQSESAQQNGRGSKISLLPRSLAPTGNPKSGAGFAMSQPLVVIPIVGGPYDGERLATRLAGLTEGIVFRYFDDEYAFVRDPRTDRWKAMRSRPDAHRHGPSNAPAR
jgi:hypothetical protein